MRQIWACCVLGTLLLARQTFAFCYHPDGTRARNDVPCLPGPDTSACCALGYACLPNKICMRTSREPTISGSTNYTYVRGSCTDKFWRAVDCPSFCTNSNSPDYDDISNSQGMMLCPDTTDSFYCRNSNVGAVDCARGRNLALHLRGKRSVITKVDEVGSSMSAYVPNCVGPHCSSTTSVLFPSSSFQVVGCGDGSCASSVAPAASSSFAPISTSSTSSSFVSSTTSSRQQPSNTKSVSSPTLTSPSPSPSPTPSPVGAIAGGVVGGVAGLLLIGGLAFWLYRRRRKSNPAEMYNNSAIWHSPVPQSPQDQEIAAKYQQQPHEVYVPPPELDSSGVSEMP